jgi:uncharacterized membrane protein
MQESKSAKEERLWLVAALLLASALRFWELGKQPLWLDEATTAEFAARDWRGTIFAEAQHPPLFSAVMHVWVRLAGESDGLLRVPSAIFGVLAVWAVWALARRLFSDPVAVRATALLAAASPYLIYLSQEARSYSLVILLSVAATNLFWQYALEPGGANRLRLGGYALLSLLLVYTHYFAAFLLLGHEIAYWRASRVRARAWLVARLAVAAGFLPWALWAGANLSMGAAAWIKPMWFNLPLTLLRYLVGYGIAPPNVTRLQDPLGVILREEAAAVLLTAGPLLWLLWRGARWLGQTARKAGEIARARATLLISLLLVPLVVLLMLSPWASLLHDRNLSFQAPFVLMLVACGWAQISERRRGLTVVVCGAIVSFSLWCYFAAPPGGAEASAFGYGLRYGKEQWREAAAYVRQQEPQAVLLVPEYLRLAFDRYWKQHGAEKQPEFFYGVEAAVRGAGEVRGRVVLVVSREGPQERELVARLGRERRVVAEKFFPRHSGIRVIVYEAAGP